MLINYLKIAIKVLQRRKFFTFVSLFGVSLTLMVLTVVTAVLDTMVGPRAPESRRGRILAVHDVEMSGPQSRSISSGGYGFLDATVRDLPGAEEVTLTGNPQTVISYVEGSKIESSLRRTDGAFWRVFDFEFVEGGPFTDSDEETGQFVAVINETTRDRFFDGRSAVGRELRADDQVFRVSGVVRDVPSTRMFTFAEIWVPISTAKSTGYRHRWLGEFKAVVLARSRRDFPHLKEEFRSRVAALQLPDPSRHDRIEAALETLVENMSRGMFGASRRSPRPTLFLVTVVLGMVLFMVLPTLNLVNLNLSRILERSSEIGVRKSFGASSRTLVGQFVVENVVLTVIGGGLGLLFSLLALRVLNGLGLIPYARFDMHPRVFLYGLALALFFGLFSGVYPAWRMSRLHPVEALRGRAA